MIYAQLFMECVLSSASVFKYDTHASSAKQSSEMTDTIELGSWQAGSSAKGQVQIVLAFHSICRRWLEVGLLSGMAALLDQH